MKEDTKLLLDWYDAERRILPWREDPTPYHVWVSEIMLQQTRVEAVKDYYARFLSTLPDVASLAAADEDTYLKLWEGLGYYSRVRNMHKAAVTIMEDYDGEIPSTAKELQKLSGIGEYTAAAIASIAFGEPVSSVDGNLLRVYARRNLYRENIKDPAAKKVAYDYYMERMPEDRPGDYNQALMDLGATVCLPNGEPECFRCPWADLCEAHKQGVELEVPVVPAKKARRIEQRNAPSLKTPGHRPSCRPLRVPERPPGTGKTHKKAGRGTLTESPRQVPLRQRPDAHLRLPAAGGEAHLLPRRMAHDRLRHRGRVPRVSAVPVVHDTPLRSGPLLHPECLRCVQVLRRRLRQKKSNKNHRNREPEKQKTIQKQRSIKKALQSVCSAGSSCL